MHQARGRGFALAFGAGSLAFRYVFDFPALDYQVPLLAFLFLLGERVHTTMAGYDERELALVEHFLGSVAEAMADHRRALGHPDR